MAPRRDVFKCKWAGCSHPPFEGKNRSSNLYKHQLRCPFNPAKLGNNVNTTVPVEQVEPPPNTPDIIDTTPPVAPQADTNTYPPPERSFGCESIDHIVGELSPTQLITLMEYPDDGMVDDLVNMLWFNLDTPENSTVRVDKDGNPQVYKGSKWRPAEPIELLRTMSSHYMALVEQCKQHPSGLWGCVGLVNEAFIREMHRIIHVPDAKDVRVSEYAPYHYKMNTISPKALAATVLRVVRENCALPREDWVRTTDFATERLGP